MSCPAPARESEYLHGIACRMTALEAWIKAWNNVLRNTPTPPIVFTELLSAELDGSTVTLVWASTEGASYQIQESPDNVSWFITSYAVTGTADTTTWVSIAGYDSLPAFRIVALPSAIICCELPEEDQPPRFFDVIVGPTGGNSYGGCSSCSGEFPYCDDPLWELTA